MSRPITYRSTQVDPSRAPFDDSARGLMTLMLRNFATDGWVFQSDNRRSRPGCIIASPSRPDDLGITDQDYVHYWVRDAAICATEVAAARIPGGFLEDYVDFAQVVQASAKSERKTLGHACFRIDGTVRPWSEQSDGPAMRILSLLGMRSQLTSESQAKADRVIQQDAEYLLGVFGQPTTNLWEETQGRGFFATAVQLRALRVLKAQGLPGVSTSQISAACDRLSASLSSFWVQGEGRYRSILEGGRGGDLNSDIVMAAVYGDLRCSDSKMLATAAKLRAVFEGLYPVNKVDAAERQIGPLIGRYEDDQYDGDQSDPGPDFGQPWALCTCNFAEFYYRVAAETRSAGQTTVTEETRPFFQQIGFDKAGSINKPADVSALRAALLNAGDRMVRAVLFHSDHLELSEQFDRFSGFEKSVRNLSWSYASALSAIRSRKSLEQAR
jgi:glucoamylase